ncbi:hypothetical protein Q3V23_21780 [Streptomyces sp. VNUA116]|uniref:hypothetical protein n=1 Tax=Streptomyces sp. VNUA116 TaxID=3062449 RepID=UPI00267755FF|nr:hypothetical protein [Streptomyces sp. VNUA116]WKU46472.1 hypothetical protein Q3V23_21780 [Streptomyces sp. VNUA116]
MTQSGQGNAPQPAAGRSWSEPWGPDAQRAPLPPEMPPGGPAGPGDSEATQYMPPVLGTAPAPAAPDASSEATQYLPPVASGPLPGAPRPPAPYAQGGAGQGGGTHGAGRVPGDAPAAPAASAESATQYLPPLSGDDSAAATQYLPPVGGGAPSGDTSAAATQYLPPVGGGAASGDTSAAATQYLPPVGGGSSGGSNGGPTGGDSAAAATQYMPPVGGGPAGGDSAAATQYLPPVGGGPASGDSAAATQYLPPVAGGAPVGGAPVGGGPVPPPPYQPPLGAGPAQGERPPPSEFDGLFRASAASAAASASVSASASAPGSAGPRGAAGAAPGHIPPPRAPHAAPPQPAPASPPSRRKLPTAAIVGIVVAGCAVAGLAAGALLSGGGDEKKSDTPQNTAVSSATPGDASDQGDGGKKEPSASADPADPVAAQAKALDALLKDSNNSRDAVIKAVDSTRDCKDLGKSASDLRDAAKQRDGLVTRLQKTAIDKLPNSAELSAQLTKAWQSSASADTHYAAWADQVGGKHGCIKGHARPSGESTAGDRASGDATAAKKQAAELWNPIAKKYGLSQHSWAQL